MIEWLEKHRIIAIILTLLIALEIFLFSSIQFGPGTAGKGFIKISTIYHFVVFFLFSFFLFVSIKGKQNVKLYHLIITLFISIIYAISDEIHQLFVPSRFFSIMDIFTNIVGISSSAALYYYVGKKQL